MTLAEVNYTLAENPEAVAFDYTDEHGTNGWVVEPVRTEWARTSASPGWHLAARVVTRDGERFGFAMPVSFEMAGITNLRPVGRPR